MLTIKTGIISTIAFVALGATTSAAAQDLVVRENGVHSIEVRFGDLDVQSTDGQRRLESRIRAAARRVCGDAPKRLSLEETMDIRNCVNLARDGAMTALASNTSERIVVAVRFEDDSTRQ
ncbi:hypothetical protein GCM10023208_14100 [Erythrobacter westpacificensis]|uniref:UrcA family protein n=1 Tax=Erythrobacter westpacificensis TaxID=1055231 RepID=A0ABP9K7C2_9SPHN